MKCEEVEAIMIDYLDNKLDKDTSLEVEKHLETCERCLDELRDFQQVMTLISEAEMVKPDDSLRINFYHMLHSEIKRSEGKKTAADQPLRIHWYNRISYRIAAGIALLICGSFIGIFINSGMRNSYQTTQLMQLQSEVTSLKKAAMFTMLKDESSSYRIQAVNYADELDTPDENIIEVLVKTLNNDKNVNVRMAAAFALSKFADQHSVCDSLVKSLSMQSDPILQVTLINILVERKEKSAINAIQQIISAKGTLKEVKAVAENGVKQLM